MLLGQQTLSTGQCLKSTATPGSLRIFFVLFFSLTLPLGSHNFSPNHNLQVNRYLLSGFRRLLLGLLRIRSPDYSFLLFQTPGFLISGYLLGLHHDWVFLI